MGEVLQDEEPMVKLHNQIVASILAVLFIAACTPASTQTPPLATVPPTPIATYPRCDRRHAMQIVRIQ
jgi:hypothetical protein